jgi:hypothetical protein
MNGVHYGTRFGASEPEPEAPLASWRGDGRLRERSPGTAVAW